MVFDNSTIKRGIENIKKIKAKKIFLNIEETIILNLIHIKHEEQAYSYLTNKLFLISLFFERFPNHRK